MSILTCNQCLNHYITTTNGCPHCAVLPSTQKSKLTMTTALLLGLGMMGCGGKDTDTADSNDTASISEPSMSLEYGVPWVDNDNDGWDEENDCDDYNAFTYPGAAEAESDSACMKDEDGDGYGDDSVEAPIEAGTDCNDEDSAINPSSEDPTMNCSAQ